MPLYEYICQDCDGRFDALVRFQETESVGCTTCNGHNVRRIISGFATIGGYDDQWVPQQAGPRAAGGCCGGSCGCGH